MKGKEEMEKNEWRKNEIRRKEGCNEVERRRKGGKEGSNDGNQCQKIWFCEVKEPPFCTECLNDSNKLPLEPWSCGVNAEITV